MLNTIIGYLIMNISIWNNFGASNSGPVFSAFAEGAAKNNVKVFYNNIDADIHVIWSVLWNGRMAGNKKIWEHCKQNKKPLVVLEVGSIQRNTTWKMALNGINRDASWVPVYEKNRSNKLGIELKPWKKEGEFIMICGQNVKSHQWSNMPPTHIWMKNYINLIRKYTDKPIILRPHPRSPVPDITREFKNVFFNNPKKITGTYDDYDFNLENVCTLISHNSNPGVQSVINGVPVIAHGSSLAYPMSIKNINDILKEHLVDRTEWLEMISHTEFTLDEISSGIPYKNLTMRLNNDIISL